MSTYPGPNIYYDNDGCLYYEIEGKKIYVNTFIQDDMTVVAPGDKIKFGNYDF